MKESYSIGGHFCLSAVESGMPIEKLIGHGEQYRTQPPTSMRLISDNDSVLKAFRAHRMWILIPFFLILFFVLVTGFVIVDRVFTQSTIGYVLVLVSGFVLATTWGLISSKIWFNRHISSVTDKREFYERSIRNGLIVKKAADNILKQNSIQLKDRIIISDTPLNEIILQKGLRLSKKQIRTKHCSYRWAEISDFKLVTTSGRGGAKLFIYLQNGKTVELGYISKNLGFIEYQIDKYLNYSISR